MVRSLSQLRAIAVRLKGVGRSTVKGSKAARKGLFPSKKERAFEQLKLGMKEMKREAGASATRKSVKLSKVFERKDLADKIRIQRQEYGSNAVRRLTKLKGSEKESAGLLGRRLLAGGIPVAVGTATAGSVYSYKKGKEHGKKGKFSYGHSLLGGDIYSIGYRIGERQVRRVNK